MYLKVKVISRAKKEKFVSSPGDDRIEISVKEKPERNMANKRVIELIALHLEVPKDKVRIVSGHHRSSKLLSISEGK